MKLLKYKMINFNITLYNQHFIEVYHFINKIHSFDILVSSVKEDEVRLGYEVMSLGKEVPTVVSKFLPAPLR